MTTTPFRFAALAAAVFISLVAQSYAADNHRQPGPAHPTPAPLQAQSVVSSASAVASKPVRPTAVTAAPRTIQPRGGDPRVTLNPQPIPPGRSKVKAP